LLEALTVAREYVVEGYVPCVWMDAGVLSFKLCDRSLDCEGCPLDRALRGQEAAGPFLAENHELEQGDYHEIPAGKGLPGFRLQRRFFYSPAHVWASVEDRGRLRLGLDDFAQQLLGPVYRVSLPEAGSQLTVRRPMAAVTNQIGAFSLRSPVEGEVVWTNQQLLTRPGLVNRAPHSLGSLLVIEPRDLQSALKDLRFGDDAENWLLEESEHLATSMLALLEARHPEVGETLPDGGSLSPELLKWMRSDPTFAAILERFLRPRNPKRGR
jgi:glycine cleavage system H protein